MEQDRYQDRQNNQENPERRERHNKIVVLVIILIALLGGGVGGLLLCRALSPALYHSITDTVHLSWLESGEKTANRLSLYHVQIDETQQRMLLRQRMYLRSSTVRYKPHIAKEKVVLGDQAATAPAITEPVTLADASITQLTMAGDNEILTGGNYRLYYFNQGDEAWRNQYFGVDPIGGYGCGPTAMAMVVSSMTGTIYNPAQVASWAAEHGYAARHSGSYLSIVNGVSTLCGLICTPFEATDGQLLYERLATGGLMVALMGPGHFTNGGHFIVLHGVTLSGHILVADPNSRENTLALWDPDLLVSELSYNRDSGGPLWHITTPFA